MLIMGPSGVGKSTFLNLLTGVLPLQQGDIRVKGCSYQGLSRRQLDRIRADHFGIIFQTLNLIPYLSGRDNAALGVQFSTHRRQRVGHLDQAINSLGVALGLTAKNLDSRATNLSIGQQQRIAMMRALLGRPALIIADEPTSALDPKSTQRFLDTLFDQLDGSEQAVLMVSHDERLIPHFDQVVELKDSTP